MRSPLTGTSAADSGGGCGGVSLLPALGLAFLTFSSGLAIYRSYSDRGRVAFVACAYGSLVLLFYCLRRYERAEQGRSHTRTRLKRKSGLFAVHGGIASPGIRLIADSAASMHAVGDRSLLRDLRYYTEPRPVTLPNGTVLNILAIGHIELEDFRITNVSLVQGFQKCLISIGQLDTDHGIATCFAQGEARMMRTDGTIVGGAILDNEDNMYVLRFLDVLAQQ